MAAIGAAMAIVGFVTAVLDMGMNGARYAGWAPWGLAMAGIGIVILWTYGQS